MIRRCHNSHQDHGGIRNADGTTEEFYPHSLFGLPFLQLTGEYASMIYQAAAYHKCVSEMHGWHRSE